jgi:hypothetical protein
METLLVRLKPYDARRGFVLQRFTYAGIKFQPERGWYRVEKSVADYLRTVRQQDADPFSPLAFDVCTDEEAKALETTETEESKVHRSATDDIKLAPARASGTVTTQDLPKAAGPAEDKAGRSVRKERE